MNKAYILIVFFLIPSKDKDIYKYKKKYNYLINFVFIIYSDIYITR